MPVRINNESSVCRRARRTAWPEQTTFHTPMKDLPRFVGVILSRQDELSGGVAWLDEVAFEPVALKAFVARHSADACAVVPRRAIEATGKQEATDLLEACLACWIDFLFVPAPKRFVLYADHDEFTTVLASSRANWRAVVQPLLDAGFRAVEYEREL